MADSATLDSRRHGLWLRYFSWLGTDSGDIVEAKLARLRDGASLASQRLFNRKEAARKLDCAFLVGKPVQLDGKWQGGGTHIPRPSRLAVPADPRP